MLFHENNPSLQDLSLLPLFEPLSSSLLQFGPVGEAPSLSRINQVLTQSGRSFVAPEKKTENFEDGYEARIFLEREIPTREHNWHDFFNALVWENFVKSKEMLNHLHYQFQKNRFPHKQRSAAENMLTLFDENGAIVIAKDAFFLDLIREHRWHELFWLRRNELKHNLKVIIFGHSIYEKALRPYMGLTAKCLMFVSNENSVFSADKLVADYLHLHKNTLCPRVLTPLPILGLPGWWPGNIDESFYKNTDYFRVRITTYS